MKCIEDLNVMMLKYGQLVFDSKDEFYEYIPILVKAGKLTPLYFKSSKDRPHFHLYMDSCIKFKYKIRDRSSSFNGKYKVFDNQRIVFPVGFWSDLSSWLLEHVEEHPGEYNFIRETETAVHI